MRKLHISRFSTLLVLVLAAALALTFVSCGGDEASTGTPVTFTVTVVGPDGAATDHQFTSAAPNLGDALLAEGFIEGNDDQYGLYITAVNDIAADFDADGAYWSLYIGEEYAMTGISSTPLTEGAVYKLVYEVWTE